MNLDTSCFWVHDYYNYHGMGMNECSGEKITYVDKDTIIGAYQYFKLVTYTSKIGISNPQIICENSYFKYDYVNYVREDTLLHKLLDPSSNVIMDFNKNIGDTLDIGLNSYNPIVDSITIYQLDGIDRKIQWGTFGLMNLYQTIEGIGATYSFPIREYGEWHSPAYRLICYSKNGKTLYPDSTSQCVKIPKIPVGLKEFKSQSIKYILTGKLFQIIGTPSYPLILDIYDISGKLLFKEKIHNSEQINLSGILNCDLYLFSLSNSENRITKLEYVEY